MRRIAARTARVAALAAAAALVIASEVAAETGGGSPIAEPAPYPIAVMPITGGSDARPIPVGAFCPARPADPLREASTFGLTALLMWALVRHRERRTEA